MENIAGYDHLVGWEEHNMMDAPLPPPRWVTTYVFQSGVQDDKSYMYLPSAAFDLYFPHRI